MTVVHYLNQFFAGHGGEEAADAEPFRIDGPVGPGNALVAAGITPDTTIGCGDDFFGQHEAEALRSLLGWIAELHPDVLICGPSFGSGRYGYACGVVAREAARRGIPVVAGMTPDSPGVLASEGAAYIVPTGSNVASMRTVLPTIASLASRLAAGAPVGGPDEEGYLPRGLRGTCTLPAPARHARSTFFCPSCRARSGPRSSRPIAGSRCRRPSRTRRR